MDKKKLKLLAVLSALCLFCVLSEAYLRGYIKPGVKQASKNKTTTDSSQNKNAMDSSSSAGNNSNKNAQKSTKEPAGIKKASSGKKIQILDPVRAADSQKVRVLVMTSGFKSYYHSSVSLTCGGSFTVSDGKNVKKYSAGKKAIFNMYGKKAKPDRKKKYIISPSGSARIKMLSIKRQDRRPLYRGTIEVKWTKQGFLVTNELPVEYYLYAVVPSEMSTSNNMEALKAQAVCARSYAYNQINAKRYKEYNADLDDSVSCQVYNNIPEDKRSRMAVDSTYGQVITNKGRIIVAYYFSTSWGCTADGQDVWNTTAEVPYLMSSLQIRKKNAAEQAEVDLSDENTFRDFINSGSYKTYDSNDDWYRWSITFNAANLSSRIDSALYNCYLLDKSLVLVQNSKGKYEQKPLKSIGTIKKLRIEKREESGLVTELVIIGTGNVVKVCTQYNIRKVLAPVYEKIKRKSGESVSSYSMLPSAAFYIDTVKTKKGTSFKISGGGFGHGAGLSQSGAAAMAEAGEDYTVIIKHFFKSTKVQDVQKVLKG